VKKRIVFITDCIDVAYSELRGVVLSQLEKLSRNHDVCVEPLVPVIPYSLLNGSFILRLMADSYPEGTIFSVIVNPLQERPARLLGRTSTKNFYFLGANTGIFNWFLNDFGIEEIYEIHDPGFFPFGGKYVSHGAGQDAHGRMATRNRSTASSKLILEILTGLVHSVSWWQRYTAPYGSTITQGSIQP